ncbi:leptin receptor isoform X2 [Cynoglossus semilaevis]|uniref:Leptin receptor n=1 Tax=Cynoglossus semilaevis TaxID=244447 RepID=A0A3P8WLX9_CYNSE|nr:leptin receptor isoform X2 [Cynoglossus semilaevis]XP_024921662.1 leptin receptor isoform X2 [Cynoglossus semilaevis]
MVSFPMLMILGHIFLATNGVWCLELRDGVSLQAGVVNLPWKDEVCCDSLTGGGKEDLKTNSTESNLLHCSIRSFTNTSLPVKPSGHGSSFNTGICLDILCRLDESWEKLTCELTSNGPTSTSREAGRMAISLQRVSQNGGSQAESVSHKPVVCEDYDSIICSVVLDSTPTFISVEVVSISDNISSQPVYLRIPAQPGKPSPPVNLSHVQTIQPELILMWNDAEYDPATDLMRYEVRYSFNRTHPDWQVVSVRGQRRVSLDLQHSINYTTQVRRSRLGESSLWSDWSESYYIYIKTVSYIPEIGLTRPGENITVYCVFNDPSIDASMAVWTLNMNQQLPQSQYHAVNRWVSQITLQPSQSRMYDLLQCTQEWSLPCSKIYIQGSSIDINCVTSGGIDAMECRWNCKQWRKTEFQYRWAYLSCKEMEEMDRAGENVGETGPPCLQVTSQENMCTIQTLRMSCYKMWLEMPSESGPISSKPIYLSPLDHVKPQPPTNVKAVSLARGVLSVTWECPLLPVEGLQCQFQYHSPSAVRAQPEWKVQSPVRDPWSEVVVPHMCRVYVVQVRCMPANGSGYWSEWSETVYSTPQNSRAPERGPDFWRVLQDDPNTNQTNVTLLFEDLPTSRHSYCVDGFKIHHQTSTGPVISRSVELVSSYSFEWNQEVQTVTVEAYNSLGSSTNNINMTLEKPPKRHCVQNFHVLVVNSTCVSLSWSLLENSSVPLFMVVQWFPHWQHHHKVQSRKTWARPPYTAGPVYLTGEFFGSEEYGFYLYPVFAHGEGEPVYTLAAPRGDPAAFMMVLLVSFLSVILVVILILSKNQMKRFVWKDVPDPNKSSWAKGKDFKQAGFQHLFQTPEGLPAWPLLLPSENISHVVIVDKPDLCTLTRAISLPPESDTELDHSGEFTELSGLMMGEAPPLDHLNTSTMSLPRIDDLLPDDSRTDQHPDSAENSAQSSVTYSTVMPPDMKEEQHCHYREGSGSSSSDEGNFSANNSDISESIPCGLQELGSCQGGEVDDPRRSCSYNSVEELSETSEQEDEGEAGREKDLYYLKVEYPEEEEEEDEEGEREDNEWHREGAAKLKVHKNILLNRSDCCVESQPLLRAEDPGTPVETLASLLYLPQFRTAPCVRQLSESQTQL